MSNRWFVVFNGVDGRAHIVGKHMGPMPYLKALHLSKVMGRNYSIKREGETE